MWVWVCVRDKGLMVFNTVSSRSFEGGNIVPYEYITVTTEVT